MPIAGHVAAPGDIVCVATYSIQRDPRVWDNPSDFAPVGHAVICHSINALRRYLTVSPHPLSLQIIDSAEQSGLLLVSAVIKEQADII